MTRDPVEMFSGDDVLIPNKLGLGLEIDETRLRDYVAKAEDPIIGKVNTSFSAVLLSAYRSNHLALLQTISLSLPVMENIDAGLMLSSFECPLQNSMKNLDIAKISWSIRWRSGKRLRIPAM